MPIYCYTTNDGKITAEKLFPIGKAPKRITLSGGRLAFRDMTAERKGGTKVSANWPMASDAAGVNPDQRQEAYDESVRLGVPTEFNSEGQAVFTSAAHRKEYCEKNGLFDRNAGYSDPLPENIT